MCRTLAKYIGLFDMKREYTELHFREYSAC